MVLQAADSCFRWVGFRSALRNDSGGANYSSGAAAAGQKLRPRGGGYPRGRRPKRGFTPPATGFRGEARPRPGATAPESGPPPSRSPSHGNMRRVGGNNERPTLRGKEPVLRWLRAAEGQRRGGACPGGVVEDDATRRRDESRICRSGSVREGIARVWAVSGLVFGRLIMG